jgi:hypothetical protein
MNSAVHNFVRVSGWMIVTFIAVVFVLAGIARIVTATPRVRAKPLLTDCERAARAIIERLLPHARVHVQVFMGALLQPKGSFNRSDTLKIRNRFSQKIVDFVIEDRASGAIVNATRSLSRPATAQSGSQPVV